MEPDESDLRNYIFLYIGHNFPSQIFLKALYESLLLSFLIFMVSLESSGSEIPALMNHLQIVVVQTLSVQIDNGYLIQSDAFLKKVCIRSLLEEKKILLFPVIQCSLYCPVLARVLNVEMQRGTNKRGNLFVTLHIMS